ncbi:MAG: hypothetical protein LWY06_02235 [Firmicutes bacterium]|nr:hypothetical protein [Bacillota bacterium]
MEIKGINSVQQSFIPSTPKTEKAETGINTRDSFSHTTHTASDSRMDAAAKLLFGEAGKKSVLYSSEMPNGEKVMLTSIAPRPRGSSAEFTGNTIPGENNNFFRALYRKDNQGQYKYSLAQMDQNGKVLGERPLFTTEKAVNRISLGGGNKNCVCIHAGNHLYISTENQQTLDFNVNSLNYARLKQAPDGTVYFLDKVSEDGTQDSSAKLTAIGTDGSIKWKRQTPVGELAVSDDGNAFVHSGYKDFFKFSAKGEVEDYSHLYEQDHSFKHCTELDGKLAVARSASRAGVHDSLTLYNNDKELFRWQSEGMIDKIEHDKANSSYLVLTSEWRKERLTALDENGQVKWDMNLPEKGINSIGMMNDDKGNILVSINFGEHTDVPDSFAEMTKSLIPAKSLKTPGTLILMVSPEGKPMAAYKDDKEESGRTPKKILSDGTIAFSSENGNLEMLTKGDKAEKFFDNMTKAEAEENSAEKPEIVVDHQAREVTIGGVKLPIGNKHKK